VKIIQPRILRERGRRFLRAESTQPRLNEYSQLIDRVDGCFSDRFVGQFESGSLGSPVDAA